MNENVGRRLPYKFTKEIFLVGRKTRSYHVELHTLSRAAPQRLRDPRLTPYFIIAQCIDYPYQTDGPNIAPSYK